jgi:hypothetical protein
MRDVDIATTHRCPSGRLSSRDRPYITRITVSAASSLAEHEQVRDLQERDTFIYLSPARPNSPNNV